VGPSTARPTVEDFKLRVRDWLRNVTVPAVPVTSDDRFELLLGWQQQLALAGWLGVDWPIEYGGQGLTPLHQEAVYEELIAVGAPLPPAAVNINVVGPTLVEWGSPEQKRRYIPKLLSAEEVWSQGFSEPNAGSDLANVQTRAVHDGDDLIITGQKIWTTFGSRADFCAVLLRTLDGSERHRGLSYVIVSLRSPGVTIRPIRQITGESDFAEVFYDQVRVPASNIIGPENEGWRVAMQTLSYERSRHVLERRASTAVIFKDLSSRVARSRDAGQQPSPIMVWRLGRASVLLIVLEAQVRKTAQRIASHEPPGPVDSIDRLLRTEAEQMINGIGLDLLGPQRTAVGADLPTLEPHRLIHDYFQSRISSIAGGTSQIQLNIVAEQFMKLPRT
jgi:alkylation response protein AidB-like acyl-CoA dehydrogenase